MRGTSSTHVPCKLAYVQDNTNMLLSTNLFSYVRCTCYRLASVGTHITPVRRHLHTVICSVMDSLFLSLLEQNCTAWKESNAPRSAQFQVKIIYSLINKNIFVNSFLKFY